MIVLDVVFLILRTYHYVRNWTQFPVQISISSRTDMAENVESSAPTCARGRGKSRGGLGKYLRARGRGRGFGRPAEFTTRLVLEGERKPDLDDEEETERSKDLAQKFSRRQLGTNADRYNEEEIELDSDGEFAAASSGSIWLYSIETLIQESPSSSLKSIYPPF